MKIINNRVQNYQKEGKSKEETALNYCNDNGFEGLWSVCDEFAEAKKQFENESEIIRNPFPITEGAEPCPRCESVRTFTYGKQTRSADEGTTTFIFCGDCGKTTRK